MKHYSIRQFSLVLVLLAFAGCSNDAAKQKPAPSPAKVLSNSLEAELKFKTSDADTPALKNARQAALDFMRQKMPDWQVEGTSIYSPDAAHFSIKVDASCKTKAPETAPLGNRNTAEPSINRQTIALIVRLFVRDNGTLYWKVERPKNPQLDTSDFTLSDFPPSGTAKETTDTVPDDDPPDPPDAY
jgi:hypothetical protein